MRPFKELAGFRTLSCKLSISSVVIILLLQFISSTGFPETIKLKSGKVINALIKEKSDTHITIYLDQTRLEIPTTDITSIEDDGLLNRLLHAKESIKNGDESSARSLMAEIDRDDLTENQIKIFDEIKSYFNKQDQLSQQEILRKQKASKNREDEILRKVDSLVERLVFDSAIDELERAVKNNPERKRCWYKLIELYKIKKRDFEEATALANFIYHFPEEDFDINSRKAITLLIECLPEDISEDLKDGVQYDRVIAIASMLHLMRDMQSQEKDIRNSEWLHWYGKILNHEAGISDINNPYKGILLSYMIHTLNVWKEAKPGVEMYYPYIVDGHYNEIEKSLLESNQSQISRPVFETLKKTVTEKKAVNQILKDNRIHILCGLINNYYEYELKEFPVELYNSLIENAIHYLKPVDSKSRYFIKAENYIRLATVLKMLSSEFQINKNSERFQKLGKSYEVLLNSARENTIAYNDPMYPEITTHMVRLVSQNPKLSDITKGISPKALDILWKEIPKMPESRSGEISGTYIFLSSNFVDSIDYHEQYDETISVIVKLSLLTDTLNKCPNNSIQSSKLDYRQEILDLKEPYTAEDFIRTVNFIEKSEIENREKLLLTAYNKMAGLVNLDSKSKNHILDYTRNIYGEIQNAMSEREPTEKIQDMIAMYDKLGKNIWEVYEVKPEREKFNSEIKLYINAYNECFEIQKIRNNLATEEDAQTLLMKVKEAQTKYRETTFQDYLISMEKSANSEYEKMREVRLNKGNQLFVNSIGMKFRLIPAGSFMMGSLPGEPGRHLSMDNNNEEPQHKVTITNAFFMGIYEVKQSEYEDIMGTNPSHFKGKDRPVEQVSWNDANVFCEKLSNMEGRKYRLPTEAEWEYACRSGTSTAFYWGDNMKDKYCCYKNTNQIGTKNVGSFEPNKFGLYDMSGNVWEWCSDYFGHYQKTSEINPTGSGSGKSRVFKGGSWGDDSSFCRSAIRGSYAPYVKQIGLGFRVCLEVTDINSDDNALTERKKESTKDESSPRYYPGTIAAWNISKVFVKKYLKAPKTADFGSWSEQRPDDCVTELGGDKFKCSGWVDAQNSFGAMLRTRFICVVRYHRYSKDWELISMQIE